MMKTLILGETLSFPARDLDNDLSFALKDICHYSEEKGMYYLQSPKLEKLKKILEREEDCGVVLDDLGHRSYEQAKRVNIAFDDEKRMFKVFLPSYPSYPLFNRVEEKKWTWRNMARRLYKDKPVYGIKFVYQLVEAIEWLKKEGYDVIVYGNVKTYLNPKEDSITVVHMKKSPLLSLKWYQDDVVASIEKFGWKGIIGDEPGTGKTISGGELIWKLFSAGLVKRGIWVVPTSPLVKQVHDELKGRYDLDTNMVTGEILKVKERLGVSKGEVIDKTIYEKHGFTVTTWSMYSRDFTGKTFHEITKGIGFDIAIFDEGHVVQMGNKAFDAVLNCTAPYRIILSGTIMPNGRWDELHDMVSAISPSSVMAKWKFKQIEKEKAEDLELDKEIMRPDQEAKKQVTRMVMPMLMRLVTRHTKEECAEFMPEMGEVSMHVPTNKMEEEVIELMINILSRTIERWKSSFGLKNGNKDERYHFKTIELAKNIIWGDLRRFCSHGAFRLKDRIKEIIDSDSRIGTWLINHFLTDLMRLKKVMESPEIRSQPKNKRVLSVLNRGDPERCLIFYESVKGCIDLAKYLKEHDRNVKIVVGDDDQFSKEDADFIGQSKKIKDKEVEKILEWFWFPWMTVANLFNIEGLDVTCIDSSGNEIKNLYYVDGHKLGKEFKVLIKWNEKIPRKTSLKLREMIGALHVSPSITVGKLIGPDERDAMRNGAGEMELDFKITGKKDKRILVTTDKLSEGANLQIAKLIVFYDYPISIKQKEQRIARAVRMESMHSKIGLVTIMCGLDYAIRKNLELKYANIPQLGYPDPNPVSMKEVLKIIRSKEFINEQMAIEEKMVAQPTILDFM